MNYLQKSHKDQIREVMEVDEGDQTEQVESIFEKGLFEDQKFQTFSENMRRVEGTMKKIQELKEKRKTLDLEIQNLNKTVATQINSLENDVSAFKERVGKIKQLYTSDVR